MQRLTRPEELDLPPPKSQRSSSMSSDKTSLSASSSLFPPSANPSPAYIAASSASQIVTSDHDSNLYDRQRPTRLGSSNAAVSPAALSLINAFLDQLLYSFLACSHSTSIASLRPAVAEVLKSRLARDAIASADEELEEFLGGGDEEELSTFHNGQEPRGDWDLNLIWRMTRLRCMVYTRLGDLEEEDETLWIGRENLDQNSDGQHRISRDLGLVSPAAAIFLTSILEFIGEQALMVAGEAAYTRFEHRQRQERFSSASIVADQRPSVEVVDMEKIAVNTTLGRIWRSWKKRVRSPSITSPGPREYLRRPGSSQSAGMSISRRTSSNETGEYGVQYDRAQNLIFKEAPAEEISPAAIPLPMTPNSIADLKDSSFLFNASRWNEKERPRSMIVSSQFVNSDPKSHARFLDDNEGERRRHRSSSLPPPTQIPYYQQSDGDLSIPKDGTYLVSETNNDPPSFEESKLSITEDGQTRGSGSATITTMYDGTIERNEEGALLEQSELLTGSQHASKEEPSTIDDGGHQDEFSEQENDDYKESRGLAQALSTTASRERRTPDGRVFLNDQNSTKNETRTDEMEANNVIAKGESRLSENNDQVGTQGFAAGKSPLSRRDVIQHASGQVSPDEERDLEQEKAAHEHTTTEPTGPNDDSPADEYDPYQVGGPSAFSNYTNQRYATKAPARDDVHGERPTVFAVSPTAFSQARPASNISDVRKQLPPVSTGVERASVQRVTPSPGGLESPIGRTSTGSNRELRLFQSAGSQTSQKPTKVRGLTGRESGDTGQYFTASRHSSEGSSSIIAGSLRTTKNDADETQRSFEQLIESDETIQYTLTPQSVRNIEVGMTILRIMSH